MGGGVLSVLLLSSTSTDDQDHCRKQARCLPRTTASTSLVHVPNRYKGGLSGGIEARSLEAGCASAPAEAERVAGGVRVDLEALRRPEVIGRLQEPRAERDGFLVRGREVVDPQV